MLAGFALVAAAPAEAGLRLLAQTTATAVALSLVYIVARPAYGVHQLSDGMQNVHAGDWRGVFGLARCWDSSRP